MLRRAAWDIRWPFVLFYTGLSLTEELSCILEMSEAILLGCWRGINMGGLGWLGRVNRAG